ncbi:Gfo/Idh/MocA family oxidoreductase [Hyphobacterium sp. SN044]|uniref:Gfo/Idh/MocA family protein n=1 Tax=Hyphobacterium sp. SN044 TaxID=2912575 RepID=UPI001F1DB6FA|nr:Gfo/Idh/MocA family oxidoreductase [Hyphobacterium sp. SN044]MCF8879913.1 Gfo/Idh/MocA family oxidoreductase [Hyphobacterium sp. SN044]
MKVAILGLGSIGRRHARCFLAAGAQEVIGFDPTEDRRKQFADEIGATAYGDQDQVLDMRPDLVLLASPNVFHACQAIAAAERGLNIFVEKPLAVTVADGEAIAEAVTKAGVYLHMGSNWKFHPAFAHMKRIIDGGGIGKVTGVQCVVGQWLPDWHPYEDYRNMYCSRKALGGGAVFDTHEIDYLTWLLGPVKDFVGMTAWSGALETETEDVAASVMRFENGALVNILTDYIQRVARRRYYISGTEGALDWDFHRGTLVHSISGEREHETFDTTLADINEMYIAQAKQVLDDIANGRKAVTPVEQALMVLKLQAKWRGDA